MGIRRNAQRTARMVARIGKAAAGVTRRRLRHGPQQPHWTWRYEVAVAFMREAFRRPGLSPERARASLDQLAARARVPPGVQIAPDVVGGVPGSWLWERDAGPTVLYLHGGGYCFGSATSHRRILTDVARRSGGKVFAAEYRLAPEHPCPAAIDDALAVYQALLERTSPRRLVVMGDSAGGGLGVAMLVAARDAGLPMPAGAILLSPWADLSMPQGSVDTFHDDDWLGTRETLSGAAALYVGDLAPTDPRVSPVYADLRGLCPTLVMVGGAEILRDDGLRLAQAMTEAGVEAELHLEPGETHVWPMMAGLSPTAPAAWSQIARFLARVAG